MRKVLKHTISLLLIIFGSIVMTSGINLFLKPHNLVTGGVSGISLILSYLTSLDTFVYYIGINIPIAIIGIFFLGKRFIIYSVFSIATVTLSLRFIPVIMVVTDPLLSAVYAGVLLGAGAGLALKLGGSTGGTEIIGAIIGKYRDISVGTAVTYINAVIVLGFSYFQNDWNIGLSSAIAIYVCGRVINFIHTDNEKVTVQIITDKPSEISTALIKLHQRGITSLSAEGVYSGSERRMLMTVVTRYELLDVKDVIRETDPAAFVNILHTLEVMGNFKRKGAKST